MKTLVTPLKSFAILLALLFACVSPTPASASSMVKGEKTLGIGAGYASYNNSAFAEVYFQYTFVPHVRIAPEVAYVFNSEHKSAFVISCDMQFPFRLARGFNIYPIVGPTFNSWSRKHDDTRYRFGADLGAGFDIYITGNLKFNVFGKYSFMKDTSGAFAGVGIGYVF